MEECKRRHEEKGARGKPLTLKPWHSALLLMRTLFPSTVREAGPDELPLKEGENSSKLGSKCVKGEWAGMPIYTLTLEERKTCPRSCLHLHDCYGNGMHMAWRYVINIMLLERIEAQVKELSARFPQGFIVRLHVLGDFATVSYAQFWLRLIQEYPALHVFGFTAHRRHTPIGRLLEAESARWDRFRLRFSDNPQSNRAAGVIYVTPGLMAPYGRHQDGLVCPVDSGDTEACGKCGLCWATNTAKDRILFIAH